MTAPEIDYSSLDRADLDQINSRVSSEMSRRDLIDGTPQQIEGIVRQYGMIGGDLEALKTRISNYIQGLLDESSEPV